MKTISIAALIAVLGVTGFAAGPSAAATPAFAVACDGGRQNEDVAKNPDHYANLLRGEGYDVSGVTEWGGCIRAFMTDASGHQSMVFFDPLTLKELGVNEASADLAN